MSQRISLSAPLDPGPPLVEFAFANPNRASSRAIASSGGYSPKNPPAATPMSPPRKSQPGPISKSELSYGTGTNPFRLGVKPSPGVQTPSPHPLLRQEVFKKAHTLPPSHPPPAKLPPRGPVPTAGPLIRGTPAQKSLNKHKSRPRGFESAHSPSPGSALKLESPTSLPNSHSGRGTNGFSSKPAEAHGESSNGAELTSFSRSAPSCFDEDIGASDNPPDVVSGLYGTTAGHGRVAPFSTPSRRSLDRATPSELGSSRGDSEVPSDIKRENQLLKAGQMFDRDEIESLKRNLEEVLEGKALVEDELQQFKARYTQQFKDLSARIGAEITSLVETQKGREAHSIETKKFSDELRTWRKENCDAIAAVEAALTSAVVFTERSTILREVHDEIDQLKAERTQTETEKQHTIDLLRDELAACVDNYTQSLTREEEARSSFNLLQATHTSVVQSLKELHEHHNGLNDKYSDLRVSESRAAQRVEELEAQVAGLKSENAQTKVLLADNERAFSGKLSSLEEENDEMRNSLTEAHKNFKSSKEDAREAYARLQALQLEKDDNTRTIAGLEQELKMKVECLDEARESNDVLERRLSDEKTAVDNIRAEHSHLKGRLVEIEKTYSVQVRELNTTLAASRQREDGLKAEVAQLKTCVSDMSAKLRKAEEYRSLDSEKNSTIERLGAKLSLLETHVTQTDLARDELAEECKTLRQASCISREREAVAQKEARNLQAIVKQHGTVADESSAKVLKVESELKQVKGILAKEEERRQAVEKKLEISVLSLNKLQVEYQTALDKAFTTEKALRLGVDRAQEQANQLQSEAVERNRELKQLRHELSTSTSAKSTLEDLVADFRTSIQQANSTHEKLQAQETTLATLTNELSNQKANVRLLEQQLSDSRARLDEQTADANVLRGTAETARTSVTILEARLKQRDQEVESIRAEVHSLRAQPIQGRSDSDLALREQVTSQEGTIQRLSSEVLALKKSSENILERYKMGQLTDLEKDLVGMITAGIVQEKNRAVNNLKGEVKRKESEIETYRITIANLKDSLAKQIKQTAGMKARAQNVETPDGRPLEWEAFNNGQMVVSSSPLSDLGSHAPDHDMPAPDTPAPQASRSHELPQRVAHIDSITNKRQKQFGTFAELNLDSGNGTDDIQEFEESTSIRDSGSANRKRHATDPEPEDEVETEERETRRKAPAPKTRKGGKAQGESVTTRQQPASDTPSGVNTRGKTTKRRKA